MAYKFENRFCFVEIEDKKYRVLFSRAVSKEAAGAAEKLRELKGSKDEAEVAAAIDAAIDIILGDGSAAEIFGGRPVSAVERLDVLVYIQNEIAAYMNRLTDVSPKK